jgi:hypothetical protein
LRGIISVPYWNTAPKFHRIAPATTTGTTASLTRRGTDRTANPKPSPNNGSALMNMR